jgi:hypothetical protein
MIKRLERLKNTVNKYIAYLRPDWLNDLPVRTEAGRKSMTRCIKKSKQNTTINSSHYCTFIKLATSLPTSLNTIHILSNTSINLWDIKNVQLGYLEVTIQEKLRSGWPGPFVKVEGCCD